LNSDREGGLNRNDDSDKEDERVGYLKSRNESPLGRRRDSDIFEVEEVKLPK
jgi:hypothetical protein